MSAAPFAPGQRWHSLTEPELGLGVVEVLEGRQVVIAFPGRAVTRRYATQAPPLERALLTVGQRVRGTDGVEFCIEEIIEDGPLLHYRGEGCQLCETDLDASLDVATPENRLSAGQVDDHRLFDLRLRALDLRHRMLSSPARGFLGGRIRLFDHQLSIARDVCERHRARVLLADEVGLGKTIEALLVLHRMLLCGRIESALIMVPPGLVHQWLAEAWLRFNLFLQVMGDDTHGGGTVDPESDDLPAELLEAQLFICPLGVEVGEAFVDEAWDLVIVDEAHHLQPGSGEFDLVEQLAARAEHLILLSATPDRGGEEAHFCRLALLDPARFHDAAAYREEGEHYRALAGTAERLQTGEPLTPADAALVRERLAGDDVPRLLATAGDEPRSRQTLLQRLLDLHGIGRVMFRNVRARIPGFPRRTLHTETVAGNPERLRREFVADAGRGEGRGPNLSADDARLTWLVDFLDRHPGDKVLALCATQKRAEAFARALGTPSRPVACFHEGLGAVSRDRQAAWFLEPDGPQIVICSRLGAEGRNFQVARHLVLLDLPLTADRLEQAIGRIDRIGQGEEVHIHVPLVTGSPQARLCQWYAEALEIFTHPWHGSPTIEREFGDRLAGSLESDDDRAWKDLVEEGRRRNAEIVAELEAGRDRLLELTSYDTAAAADLRRAIGAAEGDDELVRFMLEAFERGGLDVERLGDRSYAVRAGLDYLRPFPGFHGHEMGITFDRATALTHPDRALLSWDHPMVRDTVDDLLAHEPGNAAVARMTGEAPGLWLEALYVAEPTVDRHLRADRFLPPTPVRVLVDMHGQPVDAEPGDLAGRLAPAAAAILEQPQVGELLPGLVARARDRADEACAPLAHGALDRMRRELQPQVERLVELARVNPSVTATEIDAARAELEELEEGLQQVRVRLDALRLIVVGPA